MRRWRDQIRSHPLKATLRRHVSGCSQAQGSGLVALFTPLQTSTILAAREPPLSSRCACLCMFSLCSCAWLLLSLSSLARLRRPLASAAAHTRPRDGHIQAPFRLFFAVSIVLDERMRRAWRERDPRRDRGRGLRVAQPRSLLPALDLVFCRSSSRNRSTEGPLYRTPARVAIGHKG